MAKEEHLKIVQQSVIHWNEWRIKNSTIKPDLSGADLSDLNLSGANFTDTNLSKADLYNTDLSDTTFNRANLSNADLTETDLSKANLTEAKLIKANLSRGKLSKAILTRADLTEARLTGASMRMTNIMEANLTRAKLNNVDLKGALLNKAILKGSIINSADFSEADLSGADLRGTSSIDMAKVLNLTAEGLNALALLPMFAPLALPIAISALLFTKKGQKLGKEAGLDLNKVIDLSIDLVKLKELTIAELKGVSFRNAKLSGADLRNINLFGADLSNADLSNADLTEAILNGATLTGTNFSKANLTNASLVGAILTRANLSNSNLTYTDMRQSILVHTNIEGAKLVGCKIFGISAWAVNQNIDTIQKDLVLSDVDQPTITVDNLEVAQFVYLLLDNQKIRDVMNTVGKKGVLILGRFIPERKKVLDALREELRKNDYLPILFDFDRPTGKDFTETVMTLAGMCRFIIADITNPKSSPLELHATVPNFMIPFVPLIQEGEKPFAMFVDLWNRYDWVLEPLTYSSEIDLIKVLQKAVIEPALKRGEELETRKARELITRSTKDYQ